MVELAIGVKIEVYGVHFTWHVFSHGAMAPGEP